MAAATVAKPEKWWRWKISQIVSTRYSKNISSERTASQASTNTHWFVRVFGIHSAATSDEVIASIACLDDEVPQDVRDLLSDRYAYAAMTDGAENPYDVDAEYVEKEPDDWNFRETWSAFRLRHSVSCSLLQCRCRSGVEQHIW